VIVAVGAGLKPAPTVLPKRNMQRLFVSSKNACKDIINIIDTGQLHHLRDVLRAKPGKRLLVFDENGVEYQAMLEALSPGGAALKIIKRSAGRIRKLNLTVAVALPKKAKFDDIVDKLTQLGVARIIPMITERTIVMLDGAKAAARGLRWEKIARSAAEQSQRSDLPVIEAVKKLEEIIGECADYELKLIPALGEKHKTLKQALGAGKPKNMIIFIGPEGDFTPGEIALCQDAGFIPVTLGELVLRVETAAVAAASYIMLSSG